MNKREAQCFNELGGRWGEEHSRVLQWGDAHPTWMIAKDKLPDEDGEYVVVICGSKDEIRFTELCNYDVKHKSFSCWDYYNDTMIYYKQKDILYWMKIPEYKK